MKSHIFFFLTVCCLQNSFGQSKKEKNALLIRELKERSESYDSLKYVFLVDLYDFEDGIKKTCLNQFTTFSILENEIARLELDIDKYQSKLMRLKEPFSIVKAIQLPKTKINPDLETDLISFDPIYIEIQPKPIPDKRLKIQNEFLEKQIQTYHSIFRLNERTTRTLQVFREELKLLVPVLSEMHRIYSEYAAYLEEEKTRLINQLNNLYDEDLKKGPKNSPDLYSEVFPKGRIPNDSIIIYEESALYCMEREEADFPGGMQNLRYYIRKNYHIPQMAFEYGLEGKIWVRFTIKEDGSVSDVKVKKGVPDCRECDEEAIRVIKQMPLWRPAMMNGRAVKTVCTMPFEIRFN